MGPYARPTTDIQKLQNSISAMEERGMTSDPRYNQARTLHQSLIAQLGQSAAAGSSSGGPSEQLKELIPKVVVS